MLAKLKTSVKDSAWPLGMTFLLLAAWEAAVRLMHIRSIVLAAAIRSRRGDGQSL